MANFKTVSHFARAHLDVDFAQTLHDSMLVKRVGHAFFVIFEYEILSLLCKPCNVISIGHSQVNCRKYNIEQD
jgi:hypothetical protein